MRLLEHESKRLLATAGIAVPRGRGVSTAVEAREAARAVGPSVVVKAQVPFGGRLKAGLVAFASDEAEAGQRATELLGREVRGSVVGQVLVEERLKDATETFVAVTYDTAARQAVMLASASGGIDVEDRRVARRPFALSTPFPIHLGRELAWELGLKGEVLVQWAATAVAAARLFRERDALLVEINPLILTGESGWVAVDAHIELDDDALWRQEPALAEFDLTSRSERRVTKFEARAAEIDRSDHRGVAGRVVEFDGDLGLLIGGGGASLTIFDAILAAGGRPANYCEIGGNPTAGKVKELTKLILAQPHVRRLAVIMNVVSNTQADVIAQGAIDGVCEAGYRPSERLVAFRVPGSREAEARALLQRYGVRTFDRETSLDEVAAYVVALSEEDASGHPH
ncbi:MAG: acetate--CoA ligase family protein [Ardenticatenaceae bacterium]|nr:acetate--CoA ligase family protein [Ardenticatenaceae bacterium]